MGKLFNRFIFACFIYSFFSFPQSILAAGRFDGEYTGTVSIQSTGFIGSQVETKVIDSAFIIKTNLTAESEQLKGLVGKADFDVNGNVSADGIISGKMKGTTELTAKGKVWVIFDFDSAISGKISSGEMKWTSVATPINVKCPSTTKCSPPEAYIFEANLTRTMTSEERNTINSPQLPLGYPRGIDKSDPIIEKVIGEAETSKYGKKASWLQTFWSDLTTRQKSIDETFGKQIDHSQVWEESKSGKPFKEKDEIKTGNGRVVLKFADGTKFIVMENSLVRRAPGGGFVVEKGGIYVFFEKIGKQMRFMSGGTLISINGTKLAILKTDDKTILELYEGKADIENDGKSVSVAPGNSVTVTEEGIQPAHPIDSEVLLNGWQVIEKQIEKEVNADLLNRPEILLSAAFILGILFIVGIILVFKHKLFGIILVITPVALVSYFFAVWQRNPAQDTPVNIESEVILPTATTVPATPAPTSYLPDRSTDSSGWKTYTEKEMGFTIRHPGEIKPENYEDGTFILSLWGPKQTADTEFFDGIEITITKKPLSGKTLAEVVEENRKGSEEIAGETVAPAFPAGLGGISGLAYTAMDNDYYFIPLKSGYYFEILNLSADPGNLGYLDTATKILESMVINQ